MVIFLFLKKFQEIFISKCFKTLIEHTKLEKKKYIIEIIIIKL